jgi:hypothetical protein
MFVSSSYFYQRMSALSLFIDLNVHSFVLHQANRLLKSFVYASPYVPLRYSEYEIHLLILEPGELSDPLQCKFRITTIDDAPGYIAPSSTWGDSNIRSLVIVDNVEIQIIEGLASALQEVITFCI